MHVSRRGFLTIAAGGGAMLAASPAIGASRQPVRFVAMGCLPYGAENLPKFDRLLAAAEKADPAFLVHLGDIKSGSSRCEDAIYADIRRRFDQVGVPVVYTPGDNEWTDCHRQGMDPYERLAHLRRVFFDTPQRSLGRRPFDVVSQAQADPAFAAYVENVRFVRERIVFATLHVVGSNNNLSEAPAAAAEHAARTAANLAWLEAAIAEARRIDAPGLVLFWQADVFEEAAKYNRTGFAETLDHLATLARVFAKPVLVVHADGHRFHWRRLVDAEGRDVPYLQFLQVMGAGDIHAVEVTVDPERPGLFSVAPLIVPENGPY